MNHPAAHWNQQRADTIHCAGVLERADTASGQSEIDGAPVFRWRATGIGPSVEQPYLVATPRQHERQKSSGEACTDDIHRPLGGVI
jgi:hypothetical protein